MGQIWSIFYQSAVLTPEPNPIRKKIRRQPAASHHATSREIFFFSFFPLVLSSIMAAEL